MWINLIWGVGNDLDCKRNFSQETSEGQHWKVVKILIARGVIQTSLKRQSLFPDTWIIMVIASYFISLGPFPPTSDPRSPFSINARAVYFNVLLKPVMVSCWMLLLQPLSPLQGSFIGLPNMCFASETGCFPQHPAGTVKIPSCTTLFILSPALKPLLFHLFLKNSLN